MHKFNRIRQVAPMCPCGRTHCRHLSNKIEPPVYGGYVPCGKLLWPLVISLGTPTYRVAQIAKRFEPSTVLWALHTIQPSGYICHPTSDCKLDEEGILRTNCMRLETWRDMETWDRALTRHTCVSRLNEDRDMKNHVSRQDTCPETPSLLICEVSYSNICIIWREGW